MFYCKVHHRYLCSHRRLTASRVALVSFLVDVSDIILNIFVAFITGSIVISTQWLQGLADLLASGLIVIGVKNAKKPADKIHPFGYGRELYFWTLISGLIMISTTSVISFSLGLNQVLNPHPLNHSPLAIAVLVVGIITNTYALSLSFRRLSHSQPEKSFLDIFLHSPLVETKTTFILDLVGSLASVIGIIALGLLQITHKVQFDGYGAMVIGVTLFILALILLLSVRDLIIGRSATIKTENQIIQVVESIKGVIQVLDLRTSIIGPEAILVNLEVNLDKHLSTEKIEKLMDHIKFACVKKVPSIKHIQVEIETP